MFRQKSQLYQISHHDQQKISDIYRMISQGEDKMTELMQKYQIKSDRTSNQQQKSRHTIEISSDIAKRVGNKKSPEQIRQVPIQLPVLNNRNVKQYGKRKQTIKSSAKASDQNPYFEQAKALLDKDKFKKKLQKSYNTLSSRKKSKLKSHSVMQKQQSSVTYESRVSTERKPNFDILQSAKEQRNFRQTQLPTPLGYFQAALEQEDDNSSQQGEVPLAYYQKQYRQMMRSQCLEQTNFLYFSQNQPMKDWTQGLLILLQKHDKQLVLLRKKTKYLQKFDDKFFSIDIFRDA